MQLETDVLTPEVREVFITEALTSRPISAPNYLAEKIAIQELAAEMVDRPAEVLPRLVEIAIDMCSASSAGISVLEPETQQFRWFALSGLLSRFEGQRTPRYDSPCGVCLDLSKPVLMAHPERAYRWIRDAGIAVPEVLLVPLAVKDGTALGTLWIVANKDAQFDSGHARAMTELASFAGLALKMIQTEARLTAALRQQELLTGEMAHRVKNLFTVVNAMVRMTGRSVQTPGEMVTALTGRLHALSIAHGLVRRTFVDDVLETTDLRELIETILKPHNGNRVLQGPSRSLGQHAANDLALVLHELATNATKYGALSQAGQVAVGWAIANSTMKIDWVETGGPVVQGAPSRRGFGTTLAESTLAGRLRGTIEYHWRPEGLHVAMAVPSANLKL
jgi:two-component sensor histidine kinase